MTSKDSRLGDRYSRLLELYERGAYAEVVESGLSLLGEAQGDSDLYFLIVKAMRILKMNVEALQLIHFWIKNLKDDSRAHLILGQVYLEGKDYQNAEAEFLKASVISPTSTDGWKCLGVTYNLIKKPAHAEACLLRVINIDKYDIDANKQLGAIYISNENYKAALQCFLNILEKCPEDEIALTGAAGCYYQEDNAESGIELYKKLSSIFKDKHIYKVKLGDGLLSLRSYDEAIDNYKEACQLTNNSLKCLKKLAFAYDKTERTVSAMECYKLALEENKNEPSTEYEIINCKLGMYSKATSIFTKDMIGKDDYNSQRLFYANYHPTMCVDDIKHFYKDVCSIFYSDIQVNSLKPAVSIAGRKIKVGFISPDFKSHPCRFFYSQLFEHLDRELFDIFVYANVEFPDFVTSAVRAKVEHWRDIWKADDKTVSSQIVKDGIDILIDLAGHTTHNRLAVLASRAAPIQMTYLGFGHTTGVPNIDYFIGDQYFTPEGTENAFTEKVLRIDESAFCYHPPSFKLEVTTLPAKKNGFVTFGSLCRPVRFNDRVLETWITLLNRMPTSRLRLDLKCFGSDLNVRWFEKRLESFGFPLDRVDLCCSHPHFDAYKQIDISLDPFPHNGGTTIFESLWNGVTVISKRDRAPVGRFGDCILTPMGLGDWVVDTEDEYISRAIKLASNIDDLSGIREKLQSIVSNSVLADGKAFADRFGRKLFETAKEDIG